MKTTEVKPLFENLTHYHKLIKCFNLQENPPPSQQPSEIQPTPADHSHTPPITSEVVPLAQDPLAENLSLLHQPSPFLYPHNNLVSTTNHLEYKSLSQVLPSTKGSTANFSGYNNNYGLISPSQVTQIPAPVITNTRKASEVVDADNLEPKLPSTEINQATKSTLDTTFFEINATPLGSATQFNEATTCIIHNPQSLKHTLQSSASSEQSKTHNTSTRSQETQTMYAPLFPQMLPGYKTLKFRPDGYAPYYSVYEPTRFIPSLPPSPERSQVLSSVSISTLSSAKTIIENITSKYALIFLKFIN